MWIKFSTSSWSGLFRVALILTEELLPVQGNMDKKKRIYIKGKWQDIWIKLSTSRLSTSTWSGLFLVGPILTEESLFTVSWPPRVVTQSANTTTDVLLVPRYTVCDFTRCRYVWYMHAGGRVFLEPTHFILWVFIVQLHQQDISIPITSFNWKEIVCPKEK